MKKIRLDLEHLRVESFATAATRAAPSGTVRGRALASPETTDSTREFSDCGTCHLTCNPTACGDGECTLEEYCTKPTLGVCSCVE